MFDKLKKILKKPNLDWEKIYARAIGLNAKVQEIFLLYREKFLKFSEKHNINWPKILKPFLTIYLWCKKFYWKWQHEFNNHQKVLWSIVACLFTFVFWAAFSELEQVTRAQGQVISSSRTQVIQSMDGGMVQEIPVKEGMKVEQGQLLIRFDAERAEAAWRETYAKTSALTANVARLRAEVFGGRLDFPQNIKDDYPKFVYNETELYRKRQSAFKDEVRVLQQALGWAKQELDATEPLLKFGDVGLSEVLRLRRQVSDLEGQIINRRNKYFQDSQTELSKSQQELSSLEEVLAQRKIQLDNCKIFASRSGVVKNIRRTTIGAVIKSGEDIMEIVPEDSDLIVEAKVRPSDIGFIRPGLQANLKIDAYDYSIYGSIQGEVFYISADTIKEEARTPQQDSAYYIVRVKSDKPYLKNRSGQKVDIIPGMTTSVEIITGHKSILSYLTKPIAKTFDESMGER